MSFVACALLITGLPPLSGFVAKFSLLSAALQTSSTDTPSVAAWSLVAAVLLSGLAGIIALGRTGIRLFWSSEDTITPRLRVNEAAPVGALILACVARKSVVSGQSVYVRVDLGGRRHIKKKTHKQ